MSAAGTIAVVEADFARPNHQRDVAALTDAYARDPMGNGAPLAPEVLDRLIPALRAHPTTLVFLAYDGAQAVGIATCFLGFSTFHARPLVNVHDLAVLPAHRGQGLARRLLDAVERKARALGCCKLTLEVLENNAPARHLYTSAGLYSVTLQASGPGGANTLTKTNYVLVTNTPPPVADFSATPVNGYAPLTVQFFNLSLLATNYTWLFGDGVISSAANPANTYSNAGNYTVTLTAIGPGGTNTLVRTNYISVSNVPPPLIEAISLSNDLVTISWSSISGKVYRVQANEDLGAPTWSNLPPDVTDTGPSTTHHYPISSGQQSFYRVLLVPGGRIE